MRSYDYIIFSNIMENRLVDGKYMNKLTHNLVSELGKNKVLLVENRSEHEHASRMMSWNTRKVSLDLFILLADHFPFTESDLHRE